MAMAAEVTDVALLPVRAGVDLPGIIELEAASYPADEAATPDKLRFRAAVAARYFLVAWGTAPARAAEGRTLLGFVCGTATAADVLEEVAMSSHDAHGTTLCIHSVVVAPAFRRRGFARWMLTAYLQAVAAAPDNVIKTVLLLTHTANQALYESVGFVSRGLSAVHHGAVPWVEMARPLLPHDRLPAVYHVDAFTVRPTPAATPAAAPAASLSGNPAAIVLLPPLVPLPPGTFMAGMAAELALPVTAFVARRGDGVFSVRYFTPTVELPLCGHASLAAGRALWASGAAPPTVRAATLVTASGVAVGVRAVDDAATTVELTLPADVPTLLPPAAAAAVAHHLPRLFGLPPDRLGAGSGVLAIARNTRDVVVVVSHDVFQDMVVAPDAARALDARIVSITTDAGAAGGAGTWKLASGYAAALPRTPLDSVSRCFSPTTGTPEDPACGAAHCGIVPLLLALRGAPPPAPPPAPAAAAWFTAFQASPRGAAMEARFDAAAGSMQLRGATELVVAGHIADATYRVAATMPETDE